MRRTLELDIIRSSTHIGIIHIFDTGGVKSCFIDLSNQAKCHMGVLKNSQHVKAIGRHGQKLQAHLSDNT